MTTPATSQRRPQAPISPEIPERLQRVGRALVAPIASVLFAFAVGAIIVLVSGGNPIEAYQGLFCGGLGVFCTGDLYGSVAAPYRISETLVFTTPLILAGFSVAIAFRAGLFNIGGEGQLIMGAIGSAVVGIHFATWPGWLLLPATLLAGILAGAVWAGIAGVLKAYTGAHEVVTTIMLNYVAIYFLQYLVTGGPLQLPGQTQVSPPIGAGANLPKIFPAAAQVFGLPGSVYRVHTGIFIALICAGIFYFLLMRTTLGYEIRAVGQSQRAARYAGVSAQRTIVKTMLIAGAFAGLAGAIQTTGIYHNLPIGYQNDTTGFDAIGVALLGQNAAIGVILSAILFAALHVGSSVMQSNAGVPANLVAVLQALILFSIAANFLRSMKLRLPALRQAPIGTAPMPPGVAAIDTELDTPAELDTDVKA